MIVDLALPRLKAGEGRPEIFLATPADWTLAAECIGMHGVFDEPNARTYEKIVKPLCEGCQVKDLCLQAAMEEEGNLSSSFRAGIRGGLRPLDRALIAQEGSDYPERPEVCAERGHSMSGEGEAYWNTNQVKWMCAQCQRERKQQRIASGSGVQKQVDCGCGRRVRLRNLERHLRSAWCQKRRDVAA